MFFSKPIARSSAALAYYLTLSAFPLLICITAILTILNIQGTDIFGLLRGIIPYETFDTLVGYLDYISTVSTELVLSVGAVAMLTTSSAAFRTILGIMGELQGKMRFSGIVGFLISFLYSLLFLVTIFVSAVIILSGQWLIQSVEGYLDVQITTQLWNLIRFVILFLLLFIVIYGVYLVSAPKKEKAIPRLPGALIATVILVVASILFSHLISLSLRYEVLYGSLASFVILLVWLYLCSIILIMGNVLNISLMKTRTRNNTAEPTPER